MMAAWLQRDISGRTLRCCPGGIKGIYLGMRLARAFMPAAANHMTITHDHAAHAGIGTGTIQSFFGKPQSQGHVGVIGRRKHRGVFINLRSSRLTDFILRSLI